MLKRRMIKINKSRKGKPLSEEHRNKIGESNSKGGVQKHSSGYIMIKNKEHPFCNVAGYVYEHRLVMEKHIGRYLTRKEVVHHKNELRTDNRIENLALCSSNVEHLRAYHPKQKGV